MHNKCLVLLFHGSDDLKTCPLFCESHIFYFQRFMCLSYNHLYSLMLILTAILDILYIKYLENYKL